MPRCIRWGLWGVGGFLLTSEGLRIGFKSAAQAKQFKVARDFPLRKIKKFEASAEEKAVMI